MHPTLDAQGLLRIVADQRCRQSVDKTQKVLFTQTGIQQKVHFSRVQTICHCEVSIKGSEHLRLSGAQRQLRQRQSEGVHPYRP